MFSFTCPLYVLALCREKYFLSAWSHYWWMCARRKFLLEDHRAQVNSCFLFYKIITLYKSHLTHSTLIPTTHAAASGCLWYESRVNRVKFQNYSVFNWVGLCAFWQLQILMHFASPSLSKPFITFTNYYYRWKYFSAPQNRLSVSTGVKYLSVKTTMFDLARPCEHLFSVTQLFDIGII